MTDWIVDNQWLEESLHWIMPPPPQLVQSNGNSPIHSFGDYVYPYVDRLVSASLAEGSIDYLVLFARSSRRPTQAIVSLTSTISTLRHRRPHSEHRRLAPCPTRSN